MKSPQVPAARHTLDILRLLSTIDVPISAARIHRELGIPRSTTYHLLSEMVEAGFALQVSAPMGLAWPRILWRMLIPRSSRWCV